MPQNWTEMNGVKMHNEIAEYIKMNGFFVVLRAENDEEPIHGKMTERDLQDDGYPWIACWPNRCPVCGRFDRCTCPRSPIPLRALHLFTWDFFKGKTHPRKKGEVIHHRNLDKKDARLKNLGKGTPRAHGLAHKARRQKFSRNKKYDFGGLRFRPRQPARVTTRTDLIGKTEKISPKVPAISKARHVHEVELRLGLHHERLSAILRHLDSDHPIQKSAPSSAWRTPRTRMLKLVMPRLEPTAGEAAFVLFLVLHRFDLEAVAAATGEHVELLCAFYERPAVSEAVRRWRASKRLPLAIT